MARFPVLFRSILVCAVAALGIVVATAALAQGPDLVFVNGKVFTADAAVATAIPSAVAAQTSMERNKTGNRAIMLPLESVRSRFGSAGERARLQYFR